MSPDRVVDELDNLGGACLYRSIASARQPRRPGNPEHADFWPGCSAEVEEFPVMVGHDEDLVRRTDMREEQADRRTESRPEIQ